MAENVVLKRLKKLVAKGYVARWGQSDEDTLLLEHPRAPNLTLFSDGRIWVLTLSPNDWVGADDEGGQGRFEAFVSPNDWIATDNEADQRRFKSFLARIPKRTTLQVFRAMTVEDVWIRVAVNALVIVFTLVVTFLLIWLWRFVSSQTVAPRGVATSVWRPSKSGSLTVVADRFLNNPRFVPEQDRFARPALHGCLECCLG
ncbi:MAG: hypothetical protein ACREDO_13815 [Methyloceanibacter sp.]